jgi:hypothetical protein
MLLFNGVSPQLVCLKIVESITLVDAHGPVQLQNVLHRYIDCNNDIVLVVVFFNS